MIDTHCHLLPALDDGPRSSLESIEMARRLVRFGVRRVVCTPHYSPRFPTPVADAVSRLKGLRTSIEALEIDLQIDLAAEIWPEWAVTAPAEDIEARAFPTGYVIVELLPNTPASLVERLVKRLSSLRLHPVFAHPERCLAVQRDVALLDFARPAGALVQVVAGSLSGRGSPQVRDTGWSLIASGRVDLVATDAHRPHGTVQLGPLRTIISQRCGEDVARMLTDDNPARLVSTQGTVPIVPRSGSDLGSP